MRATNYLQLSKKQSQQCASIFKPNQTIGKVMPQNWALVSKVKYRQGPPNPKKNFPLTFKVAVNNQKVMIHSDKPWKAAKRQVLPHVMSEKATHWKCWNFRLRPSEQTSVRVQTETSTSRAQGP